jgi:hypothetical protein
VRLRILRLSGAAPPGQAGMLATAVLARLADYGTAATVVLELEGAREIDAAGREALCFLHAALRARGSSLRVVVAARHAREALCGGGPGPSADGLAVHPSMRSAVLAAYAELPGPGLVDAGVLADLAEPPEPLHRTACFTLQGRDAVQRPVGDLRPATGTSPLPVAADGRWP